MRHCDGVMFLSEQVRRSYRNEIARRLLRGELLEKAKAGDADAKYRLCRDLDLTGWYNREIGDVIGELSSVVPDLEQRPMERYVAPTLFERRW